jgi:hypothetical protein
VIAAAVGDGRCGGAPPFGYKIVSSKVCKTPSSRGAAFSRKEQSDVAGRGDS